MATRPYQGYPFTSPHVTDAPTVDAATASRWNNLPRRPLKPAPVPPRNICVDLPEDGGSQVSRRQPSGKSLESDVEPGPVIYIDLPESGGSDVAGPAVGSDPQFMQHSQPSVKTPDVEPDPVIYIDVPEDGDSDVAGPATPEPEPEYVRETIFYDQFENRRIDRQKPSGTPDPGAGAGPSRPTPPSTLDLNGAGSSDYGSSFNSPTPAYSYFSKEASLYGGDGFSLSPLPVSYYPDPPPAYTEIDTPHTPHTPSTPAEPPRTVVITPGSPDSNYSSIGLPSPHRKKMNCQHCGHSVYTLVIWEAGLITHCLAFFTFLIVLWPFLLVVYNTKWFKYKNHYCPNCNKRVGYEIPCLCMSMKYTKT